ncbi:hypothetical protein YB2330_000308 [Saitoella coloradoensis]
MSAMNALGKLQCLDFALKEKKSGKHPAIHSEGGDGVVGEHVSSQHIRFVDDEDTVSHRRPVKFTEADTAKLENVAKEVNAAIESAPNRNRQHIDKIKVRKQQQARNRRYPKALDLLTHNNGYTPYDDEFVPRGTLRGQRKHRGKIVPKVDDTSQLSGRKLRSQKKKIENREKKRNRDAIRILKKRIESPVRKNSVGNAGATTSSTGLTEHMKT